MLPEHGPVSEAERPAWWGGQDRGRQRMTLVDLMAAGTLDAPTAARLWLALDARASLVVAAGPRLVGKTTLLTALLDLLPPRYRTLLLRGIHEDFSFLGNTEPVGTYLLVPELSDHTPAYLWGDGVLRLFQALRSGYSLAATMHADTPHEVLGPLSELGVPPEDLRRLDLVVNMAVTQVQGRRLHRLTQVSFVGDERSAEPLVTWERPTDSFRPTGTLPRRLEERLRGDGIDVADALPRREEALRRWLREGVAGPAELRERVLAFYEGTGDTARG